MSEEIKVLEEDKPKRLMQLNASRIKLAEYERSYYVVTAEFGTTRDDLTRPEFWAHVSAGFKAWDRIEVRADDGTFFAEYLVTDCSRVWTIVQELRWYNLATGDVSQTVTLRFKPDWKGPHNKWCVIRQSDSQIVARELSKEEAYKQALEYERTQ